MSRHRQNDDVVWTRGQALQGWRDFFWPFAVDSRKLFVPRNKRHFRMTRYEVLRWDRAAVSVPIGSIPSLVKLLKTDDHGIHAIVEAHDGVVVIFKVDAADYVTWAQECRGLKNTMAANKIEHGRFSLHNLVPISRKTVGHGAVLFLA